MSFAITSLHAVPRTRRALRSAPTSRHAPPPHTQSRDAISETILENSVFDSFLLGNDRS